jgi:hypothetical protein
MLPKVSRKNHRITGAAGRWNGHQVVPVEQLPGLQINLKEVVAVYYRGFITR